MATETKPVDPRLPRDAQVREATTREDDLRQDTRKIVQWRPASAIPEVPTVPGWRFKWVRKAVNGQDDYVNMGKKRREGWEPVRLEEYTEMADYVDINARNSGLVEIGGLILHKLPEEVAQARQAFYAARSNQEVKAAEAQYRENARPVASMPVFQDNKTNVRFGNGQ